ncbi:uncharacterized protein LOC142577878 isoform X1 [Dermacentor variabilis]|uniref:uncharacterized protein LOC142577878 isoform X1 n=1 Tax=Dermacentor variabilis TaxID=34621 RepID=UPI003F5BC0BB
MYGLAQSLQYPVSIESDLGATSVKAVEPETVALGVETCLVRNLQQSALRHGRCPGNVTAPIQARRSVAHGVTSIKCACMSCWEKRRLDLLTCAIGTAGSDVDNTFPFLDTYLSDKKESLYLACAKFKRIPRDCQLRCRTFCALKCKLNELANAKK